MTGTQSTVLLTHKAADGALEIPEKDSTALLLDVRDESEVDVTRLGARARMVTR